MRNLPPGRGWSATAVCRVPVVLCFSRVLSWGVVEWSLVCRSDSSGRDSVIVRNTVQPTDVNRWSTPARSVSKGVGRQRHRYTNPKRERGNGLRPALFLARAF